MTQISHASPWLNSLVLRLEFAVPIQLHTWSVTAVQLPIWLALQVHVEKPMMWMLRRAAARGAKNDYSDLMLSAPLIGIIAGA